MADVKYFERAELGRLDSSGTMMRNGDWVKIIKRGHVPVTDGFGRDLYPRGDPRSSAYFGDVQIGRIFYDKDRCEFRMDDQEWGDGIRSMGIYMADEVYVITEDEARLEMAKPRS